MKKLPILTTAAGLIAAALHFAITRFAVDHKHLLVPTHPLCILLWVLIAAVVLWITLTVVKSPKLLSAGYPSGLTSAVGAIALALGIGLTVYFGRFASGRLTLLRNIVGILSVPALVWIAICRRKGNQPYFLLHAVVCLFFTLHTISRYQTWSSQSQILNYFFPMASCVLPALFAYYKTASGVDMGSFRKEILSGLLGIFFCLGAIPLSQDPFLCLTTVLWLLLNLR